MASTTDTDTDLPDSSNIVEKETSSDKTPTLMDTDVNESNSDSDSDDDQDDKEKEIKINALSKEISQNPYIYDNHVERIKLLKEIGDLHRLRDARESMSTHFPLSEDIWLDWLRDEVSLVSTPAERDKVESLFNKAFQDYQSVPIWLEYVQFAIGRMGDEDGIEKVREAFERSLSVVGLHVSQGANIWEAYREFENAITAGLLPKPGTVPSPQEEEAFSVQNQKVASLFKRQLQVPLLNMQNTLDEYKDWLGEDNVDSDTQTKFDNGLKILKDIEEFENDIISKTGSEQLQVYQDYIVFEQNKGEPPRIICLFERALKDHCLVPDVWLKYTAYLDKLKSRSQIRDGYDRALRNCPWVSQIWVNYLLALERQSTEFVKMKEIVDKALQVGFSEAADYLSIWSAYCDYLWRRISWSEDHTEQLETFQLTIEAAVDFMSENYGKDGDPEGRLRQFWAFTEAKFGKNQVKAREIWNQLIQEGHGAEAGIWLQYYQMERMFGDNKHCRKILQRALNSVTDWPESIATAYINFEREEGDLEQFDTAQTKCQAQLARIQERKAKAAEKEAVFQKKKDQTEKKSQKKNKTDVKQQNTNIKSKNTDSDMKKSEKHLKRSSDEMTEQPPSKKVKQEEESTPFHGQSVQHDSSKDHITAFVSNIDFNIEEDRLKEEFKKCGEIQEVRLVRNYKGRSKGFGYIVFSNSNEVLQALRMDRHPIDGRPVFVSRCEDRSTGIKSAPQFKYANKMEQNKVFIKNLPFTVTQEALETIFKEHGKLKDVRLVTYRNGMPKGLAYVEFEDEKCAKTAVIKTDGLKIGEHEISVAISNPPERKAKMDPLLMERTPSLGAGKRESDFRGKARTQVSLVPRSVSRQPVTKPTPKSGDSSGKGKESTDEKAGATSKMSNADFRNMLLKK